MKQIRVTGVNGRKVQAAGKWLTTIGNRVINIGDLVWTDGKCVYGHSPTSGGAPTIITSKPEEIPLLIGKYSTSTGNQYGTYNPKKGVNVFRQGEKHDGLINTRSKFALVDNNTDAHCAQDVSAGVKIFSADDYRVIVHDVATPHK